MESHALQYSKGYRAKKGYTFWEKDFDGMACKTMLRQLISKWGIMSIEMERAVTSDMGVIRDNGEVDFVESTQTVEADAEKQIAQEEPVQGIPTPQDDFESILED